MAAGLVIVAALSSGCGLGGSDSEPDQPDRSTAPQIQSRPAQVGCDRSWAPNKRTFANPTWRTDSLRLGPVTLLDAKRLARTAIVNLPIKNDLPIKIRTLVQPSTPVTIRVGSTVPTSARAGLGTGVSPSAEHEAVSFAPCPAIPREVRAIAELADVGFALFVTTDRRACVPIIVEANGRRYREVLSLGAGRCR